MRARIFHTILIFAAGLSVGAAGFQTSAARPDREARECFWSRNVTNFASVDQNRVNIRTGVREVFQLEFFGGCADISFANRIAFDTRGSSSVCDGLDVTLIVPSPIGPQRCPVRSIRRLSAEELASLPSRQRP